jgi:hypothetical protein
VLYPIRVVDEELGDGIGLAVLGGPVRGHEIWEWEDGQDCNDVYSTSPKVNVISHHTAKNKRTHDKTPASIRLGKLSELFFWLGINRWTVRGRKNFPESQSADSVAVPSGLVACQGMCQAPNPYGCRSLACNYWRLLTLASVFAIAVPTQHFLSVMSVVDDPLAGR